MFLSYSMLLEAQEQNQDHASGAQANNPLANMTALNIHNYYVPKLTDAPGDAYLNTSWLRFAKPFSEGRLLLRVSAPFNTIAFPNGTGNVNAENGLGDINALLTYNFISKPTATVGIGPVITAPTAANDVLGAGKWQAGLALVAFVVRSPQFQLVTLLPMAAWGVDGSSDGFLFSLSGIGAPFFGDLNFNTLESTGFRSSSASLTRSSPMLFKYRSVVFGLLCLSIA